MIEKKTYNLFLDDLREPRYCSVDGGDDRYRELEWVVVRSHYDFMQTIIDRFNQNEIPDIVSFDHDLANGDDKTGNDSAKFLVQWCVDNSIDLPECLVHSMNPIGAKRIRETINDYKKISGQASE